MPLYASPARLPGPVKAEDERPLAIQLTMTTKPRA
jgi:hypothetical protein